METIHLIQLPFLFGQFLLRNRAYFLIQFGFIKRIE